MMEYKTSKASHFEFEDWHFSIKNGMVNGNNRGEKDRDMRSCLFNIISRFLFVSLGLEV